jgi:hypothetical protein
MPYLESFESPKENGHGSPDISRPLHSISKAKANSSPGPYPSGTVAWEVYMGLHASVLKRDPMTSKNQ